MRKKLGKDRLILLGGVGDGSNMELVGKLKIKIPPREVREDAVVCCTCFSVALFQRLSLVPWPRGDEPQSPR